MAPKKRVKGDNKHQHILENLEQQTNELRRLTVAADLRTNAPPTPAVGRIGDKKR